MHGDGVRDSLGRAWPAGQPTLARHKPLSVHARGGRHSTGATHSCPSSHWSTASCRGPAGRVACKRHHCHCRQPKRGLLRLCFHPVLCPRTWTRCCDITAAPDDCGRGRGQPPFGNPCLTKCIGWTLWRGPGIRWRFHLSDVFLGGGLGVCCLWGELAPQGLATRGHCH